MTVLIREELGQNDLDLSTTMSVRSRPCAKPDQYPLKQVVRATRTARQLSLTTLLYPGEHR